eukprot:CAMPEP_0117428436 /NCGR_PEP_ID=MMETSP0758-20121206/8138_1 /TAXON_ID=63605 /ORGANISM="Percolomonas cosmopolitus, Strain AE-1 (ATCC 50343)" /LENGTH=488 /DNA_ID=CAMNT_0005214779 /DNA_START=104 /DNA_END=1570 /DNA_ORIENTATION=+
MIPEMFKYFPDKKNDTMNALCDLVELDDIVIKKSALNAIKTLCELNPTEVVFQMASALVQLLPDEEYTKLIAETLSELVKTNIDQALEALLNQLEGDEELRSKVLNFIRNNVLSKANRKAKDSIVTPEIEKKVVDAFTEKLPFAESVEDYINMIFTLRYLKTYSATDEGMKELANLAVDSTAIDFDDAEFNPTTDKTSLKKLLAIVPILSAAYQRGQSPDVVIAEYLLKIVPKMDGLELEEQGTILQALADLAHTLNTFTAKDYLKIFFDRMMAFLPPPAKKDEDSMKDDENTTSAEETETTPDYNLSLLEPYMIIFIKMAAKEPELLNPICGIKVNTGQPGYDLGDYPEKRGDLLDRLGLLKRTVTKFKKNIKQSKLPPRPDLSTPQEQVDEYHAKRKERTLALRLIDNIVALTQILMTKEPRFSTVEDINPSWRRGRPKKRSSHPRSNKPLVKDRRRRREATGRPASRRRRHNNGGNNRRRYSNRR